jgi:hypothetical protein
MAYNKAKLKSSGCIMQLSDTGKEWEYNGTVCNLSILRKPMTNQKRSIVQNSHQIWYTFDTG